MGFFKRNGAAGLEGHDVDMHVMAHVIGIDKPAGSPTAFGSGHRIGFHQIFIGDKRLRQVNSFNRFIGFANPVEPDRLAAPVMK